MEKIENILLIVYISKDELREVEKGLSDSGTGKKDAYTFTPTYQKFVNDLKKIGISERLIKYDEENKCLYVLKADYQKLLTAKEILGTLNEKEGNLIKNRCEEITNNIKDIESTSTEKDITIKDIFAKYSPGDIYEIKGNDPCPSGIGKKFEEGLGNTEMRKKMPEINTKFGKCKAIRAGGKVYVLFEYIPEEIIPKIVKYLEDKTVYVFENGYIFNFGNEKKATEIFEEILENFLVDRNFPYDKPLF